MVEPVTGIATIISLLASFSAGRQQGDTADHLEFIEWLGRENHQEVIKLLQDNQSVSRAVQELTSLQNEKLDELISGFNDLINAVATGVGPLQNIASALSPSVVISEQALNILTQMSELGAECLRPKRTMGDGNPSPYEVWAPRENGIGSQYVDYLKITEPQFLESDLETLRTFGLLHEDYESSGLVLRYTREAERLVVLNKN